MSSSQSQPAEAKQEKAGKRSCPEKAVQCVAYIDRTCYLTTCGAIDYMWTGIPYISATISFVADWTWFIACYPCYHEKVIECTNEMYSHPACVNTFTYYLTFWASPTGVCVASWDPRPYIFPSIIRGRGCYSSSEIERQIDNWCGCFLGCASGPASDWVREEYPGLVFGFMDAAMSDAAAFSEGNGNANTSGSGSGGGGEAERLVPPADTSQDLHRQ